MRLPFDPREIRRRLCRAWLVLCCGWTMLASLPAAETPAAPPADPARIFSDPAANVLVCPTRRIRPFLDPAISYGAFDWEILGSLVEPPFQYHYLHRPQDLLPGAVAAIPKPIYLDATGKPLPPDAPARIIAKVQYDFEVRKGMRYAPHPCLAKQGDRYLYHDLAGDAIKLPADLRAGDGFFKTGTREVTAADFVYQLRRIGDPRLQSPMKETLVDLIDGYDNFVKTATAVYTTELDLAERRRREHPEANEPPLRLTYQVPVDLNKIDIQGITVIDRYHFRIVLKRPDPLFLHRLAMPFFAPLPPEADLFFHQQAILDSPLALAWWPVTSGPFQLALPAVEGELRLIRNPHYLAWETFPAAGAPGDREAGLLADAGKPLPFLDAVRYVLFRDDKSLAAPFAAAQLDTVMVVNGALDDWVVCAPNGLYALAPMAARRGMRLCQGPVASLDFLSFNLRDANLGEVTRAQQPDQAQRAAENERHRKLRQAIAIALTHDNYVARFFPGEGRLAAGPVPPGFFGAAGPADFQASVEQWDPESKRPVRRTLDEARKLLAEAGYPQGRDPATGKPLTLVYRHFGKSMRAMEKVAWFRQQLGRVGLLLHAENAADAATRDPDRLTTEYSFFDDGWSADYADPENFLSLFASREDAQRFGGRNQCGYHNDDYDALLEKMELLPNGPERKALIEKMVAILHHDIPAVFLLHHQTAWLDQPWLYNDKPPQVSYNRMRYLRLDAAARAAALKAAKKSLLPTSPAEK